MPSPKNFHFKTLIFSESELDARQKELLQLAQKACENSYSPYSNFRVGASAILANGARVTGANQENAAFPAGLCAERILLASCQSQFPGIPIEYMVVTARKDQSDTFLAISPCGICRQSLLETEHRQGSKIPVLLSQPSGDFIEIASVSDFLPIQFDPSFLT